MTAPSWERCVVVAGHPRGGTTWLGDLLAGAPDATYVFEPLTYRRHPDTGHGPALQALLDRPEWWLGGDDVDRLPEAASSLRDHVAHLIGPAPVPCLVVKSPDTERLGFLVRALGADTVVYIRREPMAIVNSYDAGWLYRRWRVHEEWPDALAFAAERDPALAAWMRRAGRSSARRVYALAVARYRLLDLLGAGVPVLPIEYESLATRPTEVLRALFDQLGWAWDPAVERHVLDRVRPEHEEHGFIATRKTSAKRAVGWRRELPVWEQHRLARYGRSMGLAPVESRVDLAAALAGTLTWLRRRVARLGDLKDLVVHRARRARPRARG